MGLNSRMKRAQRALLRDDQLLHLRQPLEGGAGGAIEKAPQRLPVGGRSPSGLEQPIVEVSSQAPALAQNGRLLQASQQVMVIQPSDRLLGDDLPERQVVGRQSGLIENTALTGSSPAMALSRVDLPAPGPDGDDLAGLHAHAEATQNSCRLHSSRRPGA